MESRQLSEIADEILARRGINPDITPPAPPVFDPQAWRAQMAAEALDELVPPRYRDAESSHAGVDAWVREVVEDGCRESLLLGGPTGTGKTHHAYAALRAIVMAAARRPGRTLEWVAATHSGFVDELRPGGDGIDAYADADLLLLDDVGAAHITSWNSDALYRLIDHRWSAQALTIFTTNFGPNDLTTALGERFTSRLFGMSRRLIMAGADRRRA